MTNQDKADEAQIRPSSVYNHPSELLQDLELTNAGKLEVLSTWRPGAEHMQASVAEGFKASENSLLNAIELRLKHCPSDSRLVKQKHY